MLTPRNIRLSLAILVVTASIGIVTAVSLKSPGSAPQHPAPRLLPDSVDAALKNIRFTEMRDGEAAWELVAERAEYDKSGELVTLSGIRMEFSESRSTGAISVKADTGDYAVTSRKVRLAGHVKVITTSGITFETEKLNYDTATSRFRTDSPVLFQHQRLTLKAVGLVLHAREQKASFQRDVDATVAGLKVSSKKAGTARGNPK